MADPGRRGWLRLGVPLALILLLAAGVAFLLISVLPEKEVGALKVRIPGTTPVVLISFDELPLTSLLDARGRIDASRFPHFAALAGTSTWYRHTNGLADFTRRAIPSILTGRNPGYHVPPTAAAQPDNLFTFFGGKGKYHLGVQETETELCPSTLCAPAPQPPPGEKETRPQIWTRFLRGIDANPRSFYFIYWNIPHFPWKYLPSGREYSDNPNIDRDSFRTPDHLRWVNNPWMVKHALARHLLQVGYADHLLGELVNRLKGLGLWDKAMVVITADHGIAFKAGGYLRVASPEDLAQTAGVPLFVKRPRQTGGRVVDARSCDTNIAPMIAAAVHLRLPWRTDPCPKDVVVHNRYRHTIQMSEAEFLRQRGKVIREHARLYGSDNGTDGLFSFGPYKGLIGRPVRSFAVSRDPATRLLVDGAYDHPLPGVVRALLQARLTGPSRAGQAIAVAVNGRLASVSQTYTLTDQTRFLALVPPSAYRPGPNVVSAYRIEGGGRRLVLLGTVNLRP